VGGSAGDKPASFACRAVQVDGFLMWLQVLVQCVSETGCPPLMMEVYPLSSILILFFGVIENFKKE